MDYKNIIWISLNLLILFVFILISYKSFIRQKYYSGKKFIWSKDDQENRKLIGYHAYEKTLIPVCISILAFSNFIREYSSFFANIFSVLYWLLIAYVIVSLNIIRKKEG